MLELHGQDICNELTNKLTVTIPQPVQDQAVLTRHAAREQVIRNGQARLQQARRAQALILEQAITDATGPEANTKLALLINAIEDTGFQQYEEVPIVMTKMEETQFSNNWRSYRERNTNKLATHRGQAFSLPHPRAVHPTATGQDETGR
jgi:hypothetical protein